MMAWQSVANTLAFLVALCILSTSAGRGSSSAAGENRRGKFFPVFQIVNFPNDVCTSSSGGRNGTCYTADECSNSGGASAGSCADGFGVCCVFSLSCGSSSRQNNTFLVQKSVTSVTGGTCDYTICKCSSDICRIRLDFTTFDIAQPAVGTSGTTQALLIGQFGDCLNDRFSVTAPGNTASPIICGFNSGQHMYVDASDECHKVGFDIAAGDSTSRSWDIKVTQYKCGDDYAGPNGCLQYHTGATGTLASFNFPIASSTVGSTATHLSDQHYQICIRRESGNCAICYVPSISPASGDVGAENQVSFGLDQITPMSFVNEACSTDYLTIPLGQVEPVVIGTIPTVIANMVEERFCGRALSAGASAAYIQGASVCSQATPFIVGVDFNSYEVSGEDTPATGGIVGFSLDYRQVSC